MYNSRFLVSVSKAAVIGFTFVCSAFATNNGERKYEPDVLKKEVEMNEASGEGDIHAQIESRNNDAVRLNKEAEGIEFENKALEGKVMKVQKVHDFWKKIIGEDQAFLAKWAERKGDHVVVEGESLWMIAGMEYGHPYYYKWPLIYNANRDLIKDPDLIYPGWNLEIPPVK